MSSHSTGARGDGQDQPIFPGCIYTRPQIRRTLKVSDCTIKLWMNDGLLAIPNTHTGADLFFSDDLIAYFRSKREGQ